MIKKQFIYLNFASCTIWTEIALTLIYGTRDFTETNKNDVPVKLTLYSQMLIKNLHAHSVQIKVAAK